MTTGTFKAGLGVMFAVLLLAVAPSLSCSGMSSEGVYTTAVSTAGVGGSLVANGSGGAMNTATGTGGDLGLSSGTGGSGAEAGGLPCGTALTGVIRDFKEEHPDFQYVVGSEKGIVLPDLGADGKPVYANKANPLTTTTQANFDQWYRDVTDVNISIPLTIDFVDSGGDIFTYDNQAFFPIDGQGWGNEHPDHNYHFTYELHTKFRYQGGEVFTFKGDDDLFVFINRKLVIDLGGVHGAEEETVELDTIAPTVGLTLDEIYSLDLFFAERHEVNSTFRVDTSISFVDCGGPD